MIGRRSIAGLCMLCALALSAFAAQSAAAATKGTTMFTCSSSAAVKDFADADCTTKPGSSFGHVAVAENTATHLAYKNTTVQVFQSTAVGVKFKLESNSLSGTGEAINLKDPSGEHYIHGTNIKLKYTGVAVSPEPCKVKGLPGGEGVIETKPLTATTTEKGDSIVLTPMEGTVFAEWEFTGAGCALNEAGALKVVGSITCKPNGALITCNHAEITTAGTLRLGSALGAKAGYEGTSTVTGSDVLEGEGTTKPLSVTTVETA